MNRELLPISGIRAWLFCHNSYLLHFSPSILLASPLPDCLLHQSASLCALLLSQPARIHYVRLFSARMLWYLTLIFCWLLRFWNCCEFLPGWVFAGCWGFTARRLLYLVWYSYAPSPSPWRYSEPVTWRMRGDFSSRKWCAGMCVLREFEVIYWIYMLFETAYWCLLSTAYYCVVEFISAWTDMLWLIYVSYIYWAWTASCVGDDVFLGMLFGSFVDTNY